jgi:hypothetical protein
MSTPPKQTALCQKSKGELKMKGYKGFEKGLVCRGKQYAEKTASRRKRND